MIHTYHLLLAAVEDVKTLNQLAAKAEDFRRSGYFPVPSSGVIEDDMADFGGGQIPSLG